MKVIYQPVSSKKSTEYILIETLFTSVGVSTKIITLWEYKTGSPLSDPISWGFSSLKLFYMEATGFSEKDYSSFGNAF